MNKGTNSGGSIRMAIFEGDAITRFINEKFLSGYGDAVVLEQFAAISEEVIDTLRADAVLIDVHLEVDIEPLKALPARIRAVPGNENALVIAMAVVLRDEDREALADAGYRFSWIKPLSISAIDQIIDVCKNR